jgi:hypothetical protein
MGFPYEGLVGAGPAFAGSSPLSWAKETSEGPNRALLELDGPRTQPYGSSLAIHPLPPGVRWSMIRTRVALCTESPADRGHEHGHAEEEDPSIQQQEPRAFL